MDPHERIEELEAQVRALRSRSRTPFEAIRRAYPLSPACAWLVLCLYEANGAVVSYDDILEHISWSPDDTGTEVVKVQVCHVRKALGFDAVVTVHGHGYRLTPEGITLVRSVLEPKAEAAA